MQENVERVIVMSRIKKYISIMLILAITFVAFPGKAFATNSSAVGGEILKNLCEEDFIQSSAETVRKTDSLKADMQSRYLEDALESGMNNAEYYGGSYLEDGKLVIMLTDMNEEIVSSFATAVKDVVYTSKKILSYSAEIIGDDIIYRQCKTPWNNLVNTISYVSDFWESYVPSSDDNMNELMDSLVSIGIYDDKNVVFVEMLNCTEEKITLFKERIIDADYIVFDNSSGIVTESTSMKAGSQILIGSNSGYYSIGFRCKRLLSDGSYEYGFVTAGHGNSLLATVYHPISREAIGCITKRHYVNFGNTDAAFVCLYDGNSVSNLIFDTSNSLRPGAYIEENLKVRDSIEKSGYNGHEYGSIIATSVVSDTSDGMQIRDAYRAQYESAPGDSGGLIYKDKNSYLYIVGIHRSAASDGSFRDFVKIKNIKNDLGITPY